MAGEGQTVVIKWSGNEYRVTLADSSTVANMKDCIYKDTGVRPERQKLLGLKYKGKVPADDVVISELKLKPNTKIMMMGSREEELDKVKEPPPDLPEVINDFDIEEDEIAIENREEYLSKIDRRVRDYKIEVFNPPREGKKLLVLDIDYTLFDHRSVAETANELMRPFLHEFLQSAYEDYDIVIWGMSPPMYGVIEVKPLGVIWGKYHQWTPKNTIMFDDIRRNFIMNPQNGLRIKAFREAHQNRAKDRELLKLAKYLKDISTVDDFTTLNHRKWEKYRSKRKHDHSDGDNVSESLNTD
ncbi:ubiquitin-like domain-containing CTD phosphatase 1 [Ylistrum balloti]|uniref:ubiquitin-like domain-containing CTD phosphatase 1 n=1 Tax=Ylistrum balloti TaxID=509963 RepID=UPI0029059421|nr:ubiquitin-like domain-containing CTD phosphatase 1 [Ylistrum balloti]